MKVNLGIWDTLTRVVIFLLFIAGILLVAVWYLPLIKQNERMRREILRLDTVVQKEEETGKQLKNSIFALGHEPKHRRAAVTSECYRRFNSDGRRGRFPRARALMPAGILEGDQVSCARASWGRMNDCHAMIHFPRCVLVAR